MSVCATCRQPGLPASGQHDCPGLGDIQLTRQLGRGIRVDTAPARARMGLALFANRGYGLTMASNDQINIADQVLYQVVGYDAESAALILELVEDWRPGGVPDEDDEEPVGPAKPGVPRCTATWETERQGTARCWRRAVHNERESYDTHMGETEQGYRWQWLDSEPGATPHQPEPDATVCTPIPAETLAQMSKVPPELLTEQQRTRADNFEARAALREALDALTHSGGVPPTEPDVDRWRTTLDEPEERNPVDQQEQPSPVDWQAIARRRERELKQVGEARRHAEAELAWQQLVNSDFRVESRARGEKLAEAEDQLRRTRIELEHWQTVIVPELRAERDKVRATLREVLNAFTTMRRDHGQIAGHFIEGAIHPDDMDRWRAVLDPKEPDTPPTGFVPVRSVARSWGETSGDPLVVEPYRNDRGKNAWVFRCWGTATCDGWLSLDHYSQESAERKRDRHVAEEHTKEPTMPDPTPTCTATIDGPHVLGGGPVQCTREVGHPENHVGSKRGGDGKVLWSDHHAGAVPHGAPAPEEPTP